MSGLLIATCPATTTDQWSLKSSIDMVSCLKRATCFYLWFNTSIFYDRISVSRQYLKRVWNTYLRRRKKDRSTYWPPSCLTAMAFGIIRSRILSFHFFLQNPTGSILSTKSIPPTQKPMSEEDRDDSSCYIFLKSALYSIIFIVIVYLKCNLNIKCSNKNAYFKI